MSGAAGAVTPPGVSYQIDCRLDPARHRLTGWATLRYRSGADTSLPSLYFHSYPNAFRDNHTIYAQEGERYGGDYGLRFSKPPDRGWMTLDSCTVDGVPAAVDVKETLSRVDLPHPLAPGDSTEVRVRFVVQIPTHFDRLGRSGNRYSISQWYPKIVVYDKRGWRLDPFHYFSEFYGEFGTYDVSITLPDHYWVGSTGVLESVQGGDNEIPLFASKTSKDSVTVSLRVATGDTLAGRWPAKGLEVNTDLAHPPKDPDPPKLIVPKDGALALRVPRGAPVHYSYIWEEREPRDGDDAKGDQATRSEADAAGRGGPLHLLIASGDTTVTDTLRALARVAAPTDTLPPSEKTLRYHAEHVHDFAWVASPEYVRSDSTHAGIALRTLAFREDEKDWRVVNQTVAKAMTLYAHLAGPYIWPQFTYTEAFCGGGAMEYNMLVMAEPDFKTTMFRWMENTIAHELAHNWFYGMIGSDERAFPWLDEGFAQYFDHRYTDETFPKGIFVYEDRMPWLKGYSMRSRNEHDYLEGAWAHDERTLSTPANGHTGYDTYGSSAYSKPASMLHTLRGVLGDSVFTAFLREYYKRNVLKHPMPEDVEAAAEAASGQDLSGFFHSWVETLEQPSFGLLRVGTEHKNHQYSTRLVVQRKGEMVLPVVVEARFRDGSVEERRVIPESKETAVEFTSRTPLDRATLDPRHEVIEMDRLDNHVGSNWPWPSPARVRPIFGFPSSDAMGVDAGPTLWYGTAEGVRIGGWVDGRYLPSTDLPYGIRGFEAGLNLGTNDGSVAFRVGSWTRWGAIGARSRLRWLVAQDVGMRRALLSAENTITGSGRRYPHKSWRASVEYRNRYDLDPVNPLYWSEGNTIEPRLELGLDTRGPRRTEHYHLDYGHGFDPDLERPHAFDRLFGSLRQDLDLLPRADLHVGWRVAGGGAWGDEIHREVQFDVAEENRIDALRYFYANDLGPIRNTDHYYLPGGGGLRGYTDRGILGDRLLAFNLDAQHDAYPVYAFAGVARVRNYVPESWFAPPPREYQTYSEAGLGYSYGPVQLDFPFWLGTPEPGESPWKVRWRFTFTAIKLPRL